MHSPTSQTIEISLELLSGPAASAQVDPTNDIVLEVLDGIVYLVSEEDERPLTPGDIAHIPAGTPHRFWNAGDHDARVRQELVPLRAAPARTAVSWRRVLADRAPSAGRRRSLIARVEPVTG